MKVLLVGNLPEDRQESMQRFTHMLFVGLKERGHTVTILAPSLRLARLWPPYRYSGISKYLGYIDKFVLFPRSLRQFIRKNNPDVVHITDHAGAIYARGLRGVSLLATCHDLMQVRAALGEMPQQTVGRFGRYYQSWISFSLGKVRAIACVSTQTRSDVLRLIQVSPDQVEVIPNSLNYAYSQIPYSVSCARLTALGSRDSLDTDFLGGRGGFVLHVGGAHWYKNRDGLLLIYAGLRALISPPPKLVIVGPPLDADQEALSKRHALDADITIFQSISNAELEALYNQAEGLIFPSWDEGFGWPIAEAQACGCPVFASDRAPMTEVGGQHCEYFDPNDPARAALKIADAWPSRKALGASAIAGTVRWRQSTMLEAYERLYHQIAL